MTGVPPAFPLAGADGVPVFGSVDHLVSILGLKVGFQGQVDETRCGAAHHLRIVLLCTTSFP